jgi:hypothetical protein
MAEPFWNACGDRAEPSAPAFSELIEMPWSCGKRAQILGANEGPRRGWHHR